MSSSNISDSTRRLISSRRPASRSSSRRAKTGGQGLRSRTTSSQQTRSAELCWHPLYPVPSIVFEVEECGRPPQCGQAVAEVQALRNGTGGFRRVAAFADGFAAVSPLHTAGQLRHGRIHGVSGECDISRRRGSRSAMAALTLNRAAEGSLHAARWPTHGSHCVVCIDRRDGSVAGRTVRATLTLQLAAVRTLDAAGRLSHGFIGRSRVRNRGSSDDDQQSSNSKRGKGSGQHGSFSIEIGTAHDMRVRQRCE